MHIEGLRGLAIILIILFHAFPHILPNGFVGVDVFFVIAGYLLFRKPLFSDEKSALETGKAFVEKKIVRIMQPLAFVVLLALLCGYCFLTPEDFIAGAKTGISALFCASNMYLDSLSDGYFGADSGYNPLVHTWYVSVLCQLFLIFLLGSFLLRKRKRKTVLTAVSVLGLLSFIAFHEQLISATLSYYLVNYKDSYSLFPSFSYYSTCGRIWEILAGGCVTLAPIPKNGKVTVLVSVAGLILMILSVIGLPQNLHGPYYRINRYILSDCATIATVILLAYGTSGPVFKFLTMRGWILVGTISFSLYLVHMPVVIAWRSMLPLNSWQLECAVLASVAVVAIPFYFLIERHKFPGITAWIVWGAALCASTYIVNVKPKSEKWDESDLAYRPHKHEWQHCDTTLLQGYNTETLSRTAMVGSMSGTDTYHKTHLLYLGDRAQKPRFVLLGDSHAASLFFGLDDFCHEANICGLYSTTYVVPAHNYTDRKTIGIQSWYPDKEKALLEWLAIHPEIDTVILAETWEARFSYIPEEAIKQFVRILHENGKQVIVTLPIPVLSNTSKYIRTYRLNKLRGRSLKGITLGYDKYLEKTQKTRKIFAEMESEGICHILRISDALFRNGSFSAYDNGELLMYDFHHLSPEGSHRAIFGCRQQLQKLLDNKPSERNGGTE